MIDPQLEEQNTYLVRLSWAYTFRMSAKNAEQNGQKSISACLYSLALAIENNKADELATKLAEFTSDLIQDDFKFKLNEFSRNFGMNLFTDKKDKV
jgi:hypothetical protein